jgi:hypothetical protein
MTYLLEEKGFETHGVANRFLTAPLTGKHAGREEHGSSLI